MVTTFGIFDFMRFTHTILGLLKIMLFLCYALKKRHKLKNQPGRAHGFRVRAHETARRITTSLSQTHFHTNQSRDLVQNPIFKLIKRMNAFFEMWL